MPKFSEKIMDKTFDHACRSPLVSTARVSASLVYKNSIVAIKSNIKKSHPFQKKYSHRAESIYLHAENNVIVSALRRGLDVDFLKYCSLYIARAALFDRVTFSKAYVKPCLGCQSCIAAFNIKNVYYTTLNGVESL